MDVENTLVASAINEKPVMYVAAAGLTPMSPSIAVGGTLEIPVFARIVKLAAVPRSTADVERPPLSSLLESALDSLLESVASVAESLLALVLALVPALVLALALASEAVVVVVGSELTPDVEPVGSAVSDWVDESPSAFPHARPKTKERLQRGAR